MNHFFNIPQTFSNFLNSPFSSGKHLQFTQVFARNARFRCTAARLAVGGAIYSGKNGIIGVELGRFGKGEGREGSGLRHMGFYDISKRNIYLGGGNSNIFYFHPYLGKIPILTNIFQMG